MSNGHPNGHAPSQPTQHRSNGATDTAGISAGQSNGQTNGHNGHTKPTDTTTPSRGGWWSVALAGSDLGTHTNGPMPVGRTEHGPWGPLGWGVRGTSGPVCGDAGEFSVLCLGRTPKAPPGALPPTHSQFGAISAGSRISLSFSIASTGRA